jgi:oxygen-independent coproporphyrinogen-3 oxidase
MAGLYIHIPFCKKACYYCDFHSVASLKDKSELLQALRKELILRKEEWISHTFDTIYFGGGTPTVLSVEEIQQLILTIFENYTFENNLEFTIEANPDDLSSSYLDNLRKKTPVNRLSIGIQSFHDGILKFLNRRHNSTQALESIIHAKNAGFTNITVDLIYGIPGLTETEWKKTLNLFFSLNINHLSAYHLGIEPKTVFSVWQKKGKFIPIKEEESIKQYETLITTMKQNEFQHYEISNFAKNKQFSKHNTSYWNSVPYLGIGPSAHSYVNNQRRWNISNNSKYIVSILNNRNDYFEQETLSLQDQFNDYILTSLRTSQGLNISYIRDNFGTKHYNHCLNVYRRMKESNNIILDNEKLYISEKGWFVSDYLISEFFII